MIATTYKLMMPNGDEYSGLVVERTTKSGELQFVTQRRLKVPADAWLERAADRKLFAVRVEDAGGASQGGCRFVARLSGDEKF